MAKDDLFKTSFKYKFIHVYLKGQQHFIELESRIDTDLYTNKMHI